MSVAGYAIGALILAGIPVAEFLRKRGKADGLVIYTIPWRWLVDAVHRVAYHINWWVFGDVAVVFLLGPFLGRRFVERRRLAVTAFFSFVIYLFVIVPLLSGGDTHMFSFFSASVPSLLILTLSGFSGYALFLIASSAAGIIYAYFAGYTPEPGIGLAIPGTSIGPLHIPLVEGVIALVLALLFHETAHGVVSVRERVPVRKGGVLTLGLLPIGAYVEPDEKIFQRAPLLSRIRVYSAGPFANLLVFIVALSLLLLLSPVSNMLSEYDCSISNGVRVLSVPETLDVGGTLIRSPSHGILQPGDIITEINGTSIQCYNEFFDVLDPIREEEANVPLTLTVLREGKELNLSVVTNQGYIGIKGVENNYVAEHPLWYSLLFFIISTISWIAFLNFMIGLVNMLPLIPLDGGYVYADVFSKLKKRWVSSLLFWLSILVLVVNALPWFIK